MTPGPLLTVACLAALAASAQSPPVFRVPVRLVAVPTAVVSPDGKPVWGLREHDFSLFDNGIRQEVEVEYQEDPLAVAIVIQQNNAVGKLLPLVRRARSVFESQLIGEGGEASVIAFGDEVRVVQTPASSLALLDKALISISPTGDNRHCLDALLEAAGILERAPPARRRIILLIAQPGDHGSSARLRNVIQETELNNITIYHLVMPHSAVADTLGLFAGDPFTQIPEIYQDLKADAHRDATSILTTYLGGRSFPFRKLRDLEAGISAIGEEIHTQYILTYKPNNNQPGYHEIKVAVDRPASVVRARPGYYVVQ